MVKRSCGGKEVAKASKQAAQLKVKKEAAGPSSTACGRFGSALREGCNHTPPLIRRCMNTPQPINDFSAQRKDVNTTQSHNTNAKEVHAYVATHQ